MSETETTTTSTPASPPPQPQYQQPPPQPQYQQPPHYQAPPQPTPGKELSKADQIAELRAEAAQWRISFRQAQDREREAMERMEQLRGEIESTKTKAMAPLQEKLAKATERARQMAINSALIEMGLQDPDLVHLVTKMPDAPEVKISEEFEVSGARELAAAFKKWKPDLFRAPAAEPAPDAKPRAPARTSAGQEPEPSREAPTTNVKGMNKQEYDKFKQEWMRRLRSEGRARA